MHQYQSRVIEEKEQLDMKIAALQAFINGSPSFDNISYLDKTLLAEQLTHMRAYSGTLAARIDRF